MTPVALSKPKKVKAEPTVKHLQQTKEIVKSTGLVLPIVEASLLKRSHEHEADRDKKHLHPSEMSKEDWCPRSSWYRMSGYPIEREDSFSFHLSNIFEEGHDIHNKYQTWLWDAGVLGGLWKCLNPPCRRGWHARSPKQCPYCGESLIVYAEVPLYDERYMLIGHADGLVWVMDTETGEWVVIEIKSVGVRTVEIEAPTLFAPYKAGEITLNELWNKVRRPFPSHQKQGSLYCRILGIRRVVFIYEWKPTQARREFVVTPRPEQADELLALAETVVHSMRSGFPPQRPQWASSEQHAWCKKCPYRDQCWNGEHHDDPQDQPQRERRSVAPVTTAQLGRRVRRVGR